jgi:phage FluMu protein gp41
MEQPRTPARIPSNIDDLFELHLVDGLPVQSEGKTIRYKVVRLRETGVAHERAAVKQAERVMLVGGVPKLLVSESDFRFALTAQHIESFHCDGQTISAALIDLGVVGQLSTHDFGLVEQRVFLITLAAEVRYGNISEAEFDAYLAGQQPAEAPQSPQPVGQAENVGAVAPAPESGPALLADFARDGAARSPHGDGR